MPPSAAVPCNSPAMLHSRTIANFRDCGWYPEYRRYHHQQSPECEHGPESRRRDCDRQRGSHGNHRDLGAITVQSGFSTVNLTAGTANLAVTATNLTGNPGQLLTLSVPSPAGADQLIFNNAPTLSNGILPFATITNGATYDFATTTGTGPYNLAPYSSYAATLGKPRLPVSSS